MGLAVRTPFLPPMRRHHESRSAASPPRSHGAHTLEVRRGVVVGVYGRDVFVELGPRVQGVLALSQFRRPPRVGDEHAFTLRGQEEGLWVLRLVREPALPSWEAMEVGAVVEARVVRPRPGGLEAKVGDLHAFLPRSQTGLPRERDVRELSGRTLVCEVIEVDPERQRIVLSRKLWERRQRESARQRAAGSLRVGAVVSGRVVRVEPYGAFVELSPGLQGLIHVSDLAWERPPSVSARVAVGERVDVKVLSIRRGGKRIGLGLKQMQPSPWERLDAKAWTGRRVLGQVTRILPFGAFVRVAPGIEALLPAAAADLSPGRRLDQELTAGAPVAVRVVSVEPARERMALSRLHPHGARVLPEDVEAEGSAPPPDAGRLRQGLAAALRRALEEE